MANTGEGRIPPWSLSVGSLVMAGMAVTSGVAACIAMIVGGDAVARMSAESGCSYAAAALGSLIYARLRSKRAA